MLKLKAGGLKVYQVKQQALESIFAEVLSSKAGAGMWHTSSAHPGPELMRMQYAPSARPGLAGSSAAATRFKKQARGLSRGIPIHYR